MKKFNYSRPFFRIRIRCEGEENPTLFDLNSFLRDFNLIYELSRITTDPNYEEFDIHSLLINSLEGFYIHLTDNDRLRVEKLSKESPLELTTILTATMAAVGSIWGLVQILEKVANFRLNRKKLQEEIKKLERENNLAESPPSESEVKDSSLLYQNSKFLQKRIDDRGVRRSYEVVTERLIRSKIEITEVEIEIHNLK